MQETIRIIGIDPGLRRTGWGLIEARGNALRFIASGTVCSEATFVNKDATATLKLGQARGIAMLVPARAGLAVAEYAPNAVKKAVIGVGHGDKKQINMMVRVLLPKASFEGADAADALALAICHAHHRQGLGARLAALVQ